MKKIGRGLCALSLLFSAFMLAVAYTPAANWAARPLIIASPEPGKADLLAVLGGGVNSNGVLSSKSSERFMRGILLYREGHSQRILFSGGATDGRVLSEAEAMGNIAKSIGVPPAAVIQEKRSRNTYENIAFIRAYMAENGLKSCIIVTSATHMMRATLVAERLGMEFVPAPAPDTTYLVTGLSGRLALFKEVMHEYLGIVYYKYKGYI